MFGSSCALFLDPVTNVVKVIPRSSGQQVVIEPPARSYVLVQVQFTLSFLPQSVMGYPIEAMRRTAVAFNYQQLQPVFGGTLTAEQSAVVQRAVRDEIRATPGDEQLAALMALPDNSLVIEWRELARPVGNLGIAMMAVLIVVVVGARVYRRELVEGRWQAGHCLECGYDLNGRSRVTCPECGTEN